MFDFMTCLDPGHGGNNMGCQYNGLLEKDWNLSCTKELSDSLFGAGVSMTATRHSDGHVSQIERGTRSSGANFVLSVHVNALKGHPNIRGAECYIWPGNKRAKHIAGRILECMPSELRTNRIIEAEVDDNGTQWLENPRAILKVHQAPTVLVEVGYASNDNDRAFLLSKWGRSAVVSALRAGIVEAAKVITAQQQIQR